MRKRMLALGLCAAMVVGTVAGCSSSKAPEEKKEETTTTAAAAAGESKEESKEIGRAHV